MSALPPIAPISDARRGWRSLVRRGVRSRLGHFVALGALVFALAPNERGERVLRIDASRVERAIREEQVRLGRVPTTDEKQRIMQELVDDELLFREGRRLGLDANDDVVRARVAETMRRSLAAAVPSSAVDEEELARESAALAVRAPVRVRLMVWFVSRDRLDAAHVAEQLARDVARGESPKSPDPPPIPADAIYTMETLARAAGGEVARIAFATPVGERSEPVASAWGFYVLRPLERRPMDPSEARAAAFEAIRSRKAKAEIARAAANAARDWEVIVAAPPGEPAYDPKASAARAAGEAM